MAGNILVIHRDGVTKTVDRIVQHPLVDIVFADTREKFRGLIFWHGPHIWQSGVGIYDLRVYASRVARSPRFILLLDPDGRLTQLCLRAARSCRCRKVL